MALRARENMERVRVNYLQGSEVKLSYTLKYDTLRNVKYLE